MSWSKVRIGPKGYKIDVEIRYRGVLATENGGMTWCVTPSPREAIQRDFHIAPLGLARCLKAGLITLTRIAFVRVEVGSLRLHKIADSKGESPAFEG